MRKGFRPLVALLFMLGLLVMLLWVPYKAVYQWGDDTQTTATAGYSLVFAPPSAVRCVSSIKSYLQVPINLQTRRCQIWLDKERLLLTLTALSLALATPFFLRLLFPAAGAGGKRILNTNSAGHIASEPPGFGAQIKNRVRPPAVYDKIMIGILIVNFLLWVPYQLVFGTKVAHNSIHQLIVSAGRSFSEVDSDLIYASLTVYGMAPLTGVVGGLALVMLFAKSRAWYLAAVSALALKMLVVVFSYPLMLAVFEAHEVMLSVEARERVLYASMAKALISSLFTIIMSTYLLLRGRWTFAP